jgi:hypothetical protein
MVKQTLSLSSRCIWALIPLIGRVLGTDPAEQDRDVQLFAGFLRVVPGKVDYYGPTDHEESGIVVRGKQIEDIVNRHLLIVLGELNLEDETGKKVTLQQGEAFFIRRQSQIIFSAKRFALVFKCSSYAAGYGKSKELIV